MPSEEEQYISIRKTLKHLKGKPLTIRTLDVGNDKQVPSIEKYLTKSPNPALGLRAIRLTLAYPKDFQKTNNIGSKGKFFWKYKNNASNGFKRIELIETKKIINDVKNEILKEKKKNRIKDSENRSIN